MIEDYLSLPALDFWQKAFAISLIKDRADAGASPEECKELVMLINEKPIKRHSLDNAHG